MKLGKQLEFLPKSAGSFLFHVCSYLAPALTRHYSGVSVSNLCSHDEILIDNIGILKNKWKLRNIYADSKNPAS
jgi:hypothetical protein